jgi:hypothetical protein
MRSPVQTMILGVTSPPDMLGEGLDSHLTVIAAVKNWFLNQKYEDYVSFLACSTHLWFGTPYSRMEGRIEFCQIFPLTPLNY